jgi:hypothetical protein
MSDSAKDILLCEDTLASGDALDDVLDDVALTRSGLRKDCHSCHHAEVPLVVAKGLLRLQLLRQPHREDETPIRGDLLVGHGKGISDINLGRSRLLQRSELSSNGRMRLRDAEGVARLWLPCAEGDHVAFLLGVCELLHFVNLNIDQLEAKSTHGP